MFSLLKLSLPKLKPIVYDFFENKDDQYKTQVGVYFRNIKLYIF